MTMKRVALMLTLMMLVGTLSTPLLSELHDEVPVVLDVEDADVMTSHGGSNEHVEIDPSGHVYEHPNGTKVWDSGTWVYQTIYMYNLTVGENYTMHWWLWDHTGVNQITNGTNNINSAVNSTHSHAITHLSLADGTYVIEAGLYASNGTMLSADLVTIQVGNSSGTSAGNGQVYVDIDHSGYVYEHPNGTEVWASGSDVYVEFTSGNLTVGEEYQLIWNLSDSTWNAGVHAYDWGVYWNATSNTSVEHSTISGLADGVYYFHATLVNQGSHVATDMTMIIVGNSTVPSPCTHLDVLPRTEADDPSQMSPWTPDPNGDGNRSVWTYGVDIFNAYAHHTCLEAGIYDWNFSLYDANGYMPNFYEDGMFEIHDDDSGSHFDFLVRNFEATDLPVGQYTWWYGISNYTMGISEWAHHNFTVLGNTTDPVDPTHLDCSALDTSGGIDGEVFIHNVSNTYASGEPILALLEVCWTPSNVSMWYTTWLNHSETGNTVEDWSAQGAGNFPGWWHAVEHNDGHATFPMDYHYGVANAWDLTIDSLPWDGEYCYEATLKVFDNVLGAYFHVDADGPACFEFTTGNGTGDGTGDGMGNGTGDGTNDDLLGYCSFPTFEATPAAVQSGDDMTFTWTMDGDVSDEVYLSLSSGWGAQYYFSSVEDNDGSHTITLPANMNPNEDYTIYIESATNGQRGSGDQSISVCWKYGSVDVLENDEGVVLDDIINDFLNTTDERPRISMWYGKVNQHNWNGTWMTDSDGVAGAGLYSQWGSEGWGDRKLEYCQRFWPDTVEIRNSAPEEIVFYTRGNTDAYLTMKPVWLCVQDTDGDGILDPEDEDDDGDGWPDIFEDVCLSDALDPNVMPEDLDGDGLCDVLQILLVGDFEPPEPGFCTDGEITGGNGLMGQDVYTEVVVIEMTGGTYQYQYEIHDWTNELHEDLQQDASNHDFRGYYEYYDIFFADADGNYNPNGSFVTIQARSDLSTTNLGVGHNIDSIGIRDANGNVLYASEIVSVDLGGGLGSNNPDGRQSAILGPADQIPTALGNGQAQITVGFCPEEVEPVDEPSPGFGAMAALAALGAAMFAGRRGLLEEQDAE